MELPDFFREAPTVTLRDPLAAFLGVSASGVMTYTYADAVRLAGHSCPTVAGAYLMVIRGLQHIYGSETPVRGDIAVFLRDPREKGTTGVTASIATLITGAATETGFGGIGSQQWFSRRNLLQYGAPISGTLALQRRDNGRGVVLSYNAGIVPPATEMAALFPSVLAGTASSEDILKFGTLWQNRVERILTISVDDPRLIQLQDWNTEASAA